VGFDEVDDRDHRRVGQVDLGHENLRASGTREVKEGERGAEEFRSGHETRRVADGARGMPYKFARRFKVLAQGAVKFSQDRFGNGGRVEDQGHRGGFPPSK
jgi:hypothetical protein